MVGLSENNRWSDIKWMRSGFSHALLAPTWLLSQRKPSMVTAVYRQLCATESTRWLLGWVNNVQVLIKKFCLLLLGCSRWKPILVTAVPRQLWKMTRHEGVSDQDEDLYFDQDARSFQDEDLAGEELEFVTIIKIGNEQSEVEKVNQLSSMIRPFKLWQ